MYPVGLFINYLLNLKIISFKTAGTSTFVPITFFIYYSYQEKLRDLAR